MSETVIPVGATPNQVQVILGYVKKGLALGEMLSKFTKTDTDDKAVAWAEGFVAFVEPYAGDPEIVEVINLVISLFKKDGAKAAVEKLKALAA